MLGYGEDCLTLWALKNRISEIQNEFQDTTNPLIIFYRPSFSKRGGFGEFDSIFASSKNIYLIESKWDNNSEFKNFKFPMKSEQEIRHRIFSWYLLNWNTKYINKWETFMKENRDNFHAQFPEKIIAPVKSLLARNIEYILTELQGHYGKKPEKENIKDVLLFFYNKNKNNSSSVALTDRGFKLVKIDYSQELVDNFINLDCKFNLRTDFLIV